MNKRITPREYGLLKGAINRVFSRSELRKLALDATRIEHHDPKRPRVTKWSKCPICLKPEPTYLLEVDHKITRVPFDTSFAEMSKDVYIDRTFCAVEELQAICKPCHKIKTLGEKKLRTVLKPKKRNKK